jgi:hypothetical protein
MSKRRTPVGGNTDDTKKRRLPIADKRDRLWFPDDPSKKRVIVTTKLLNDYLDSGFTHVKWTDIGLVGQGGIEEGSRMGEYVSWNVGRADGMENATGWLVEMPMDMWLDEIKPIIERERGAPVREIHKEIEKGRKSGDIYGKLDVDESEVT